MKKLGFIILGVLVLLVIAIVIWVKIDKSYLPPQEGTNTTQYSGKDCGSEISTKGNNKDTIDRNCFIEAYKACTPAKISQQVVDPNNHTITTNIYVDGVKKDNNCQVSVHSENKYTIPENDIYYCYKAEIGGADNVGSTTLKFDNCTNKKPLFF